MIQKRTRELISLRVSIALLVLALPVIVIVGGYILYRVGSQIWNNPSSPWTRPGMVMVPIFMLGLYLFGRWVVMRTEKWHARLPEWAWTLIFGAAIVGGAVALLQFFPIPNR